ncbi:MmcQ/YjbR family DNA-binding protein [Actinokineospora globicatena]|uniref:Phosphoribosylglycinamide formyltransferase n=1 Tax=Actinokineospora globicatena TaxID=103729 RepID=A0A9W6V8A1_9PSEU|nr:MmcQ/YjbR family DNA-binding protein [Actinokineospora globicatena]GLW93695.1 phosphoribosylglycinamide formyltransferase [Actinokineospora globicatena]
MARTNPLPRLRKTCLALPGVTEKISHGSPSWFARGDKGMFVSFVGEHHGERLAFWCAAPPGAQEEMVAEDPDRFFRPPYVGHRGWLGVHLDGDNDWAEIAEIVDQAYRLIATKRSIAELDAREG